jgi:hypothetical protein
VIHSILKKNYQSGFSKSILRIFEAVNQDIPDSGSRRNSVFFLLLIMIAGARASLRGKPCPAGFDLQLRPEED